MAGLIQIGQSALAAAYAQLQTGGHNIANVHTPGYVRQEVQLATAGGQYHGHGYIGNGVEVQDVRRAYDRFMSDEVTRTTSLAGADAVRAQQMSQVDNLLADTETGIGAAMDEFRAAIGDMVNHPADASARAVVVSRADSVARRISDTALRLETMVADAGKRMEEASEYVNVRLDQVASLNGKISEAMANGHQPNDLKDQRDVLINELAAKIQLTRDDQLDGSVNLYSANGHSLVLSDRAAALKVAPGNADSARSRLLLDITGKQVELTESTLGSGEIAGLMRFRDQDLLAVQSSLGRLAAAFAGAYNQQQAKGLDEQGNRGGPMFEVGSPLVQSGEKNTGNAQFSARIEDPSKLKASDYRLTYDGSVYQLEDVVTKNRREFTQVPISVDGLRIEQTAGNMAAGDSMFIQAGTVYAGRMRSLLHDGKDIAAADPMSYKKGVLNRGSVQVADLVEETTGMGRIDPIRITFTAADRYSVSVNGNVVAADQRYVPGASVSVNGWKVSLEGQAVTGDTIDLEKRKFPKMDNGNVHNMVLLADERTVDGETFNQSFESLLSDVGSRSLLSKTAEKASSRMLDGAKATLANRSGVNLDEEAARLLQYRQAYQAAAKVIQTADEMFNSILAIAR
ncbi:MAG: flagellar hook-associated protein FlgK [Lautropia sp.]|nr:flagellar hook-associated protein FlgK [Lautropia sp.]